MAELQKDFITAAQDSAKTLLKSAVLDATSAGELPDIKLPELSIEIPADTSHGDFASNLALVSAKTMGQSPRKIAETIVKHIQLENTIFERIELAGPGFINFFLRQEWYGQVVSAITALGENYGRTDFGAGKKVMVEFVSANPTGPMHMGNARGGAIGDCLASALEMAGYDVTREFYVNDAGNQIEKFGISLEARYLQKYKGTEAVAFPEDGYHGEDITDRAEQFAEIHGEKYLNADPEVRRKALVDFALPANISALHNDLAEYRINYDNWFHESSLYENGVVEQIVERLKSRGLTYEKDGALWYKATEYGAEKDEVLIRQNGNPTYFAADIAYHYNKFIVRGFDTVINVWGADHHGHVARLKGAMDAIGIGNKRLDIVLMQLVRLLKDGQPYRMSKRTGRSITLSDLTELIPIDAARFFFNMREPNSTLDFDLNLAAEQSSQNPVYYVQYAHARICSIFAKLKEDGVQLSQATSEELQKLSTAEEILLIRRLAEYPSEIIYAAENYDPARLTHYLVDLSAQFHKFYAACRVNTEDKSLMRARLELCTSVKTVLSNALTLLKITAPISM